MLFSVTTLWTFIACLFVAIWLWWRRPHPKFPPGPRGFPILGVLPFLNEISHEKFRKWGLIFGDVMSLRLGRRDVVVLNSYDAINQALVKQSALFAGRYLSIVFRQVTQDNGVVFRDYSADFKRQRHFGLQALRKGGFEKIRMEEIVLNEGKCLVSSLKAKVGIPINIAPLLYRTSGNIIATIVFGQRFDESDKDFEKILHNLHFLFADPKLTKNLNLIGLFSFIVYFPAFRKANEECVKLQKEILAIIQNKIQKHKEYFDKNPEAQDFLSLYLHEQQHTRDPSFTDEQLVVYARDLFIAGMETVSSSLCWAIVFLLNYPAYYDKIDEEVSNVFGSDESVTISLKDNLPFTCAFLQEVLRYRTPAPVAFHKTMEDVELKGFHIPKYTQVIVNLHAACWDPKVWQVPDKFRPERHIDADGKFIFSPKIISFSLGHRYCMGESLARCEFFLLFVILLRSFKLEFVNEKPSMDGRATNIVLSPREFEVLLTEKSCP